MTTSESREQVLQARSDGYQPHVARLPDIRKQTCRETYTQVNRGLLQRLARPPGLPFLAIAILLKGGSERDNATRPHVRNATHPQFDARS